MIDSQKTDWDCGPTALHNAAIWCGSSFRYADFIVGREGMSDEELEYYLDLMPCRMVAKSDHLYLPENTAAILAYIEDDGDWHFAFHDGKKVWNSCLKDENVPKAMKKSTGSYCLVLGK